MRVGGFGVVFSNEEIGNFYSPVTRNPPAEVTITVVDVQACALALVTCMELGMENVTINTDSKVIKNIIGKYLNEWKSNDWENPDGSDLVVNLK